MVFSSGVFTVKAFYNKSSDARFRALITTYNIPHGISVLDCGTFSFPVRDGLEKWGYRGYLSFSKRQVLV